MSETFQTPQSANVPPVVNYPDENKKLFNMMLKGAFERIPKGYSYASSLGPIETVSVFQAPSNKTATDASKKKLMMVPSWKSERGTNVNDTFIVDADGNIKTIDPRLRGDTVKLLREVSMDRILNEALHDMRDKRFQEPGSIRNMKTLINPPGIGEPRPKMEKKEPAVVLEEKREDDERLKYLMSHPARLYCGINGEMGLKEGYRAFIFPNFAICENPEIGNAAYFVDFDGRFAQTREELAPMTDEEVEAILLSIPGSERIRLLRSEKRQKGFTRVEHRADWKKRMEDEIQKRLAKLAETAEPEEDQKSNPFLAG